MIRLGFCKACKGNVSEEAMACPKCGQPEPYEPLPADIDLLISRGLVIDAIKRVRELTGMDLKDSKDFVDAYAKERRA